MSEAVIVHKHRVNELTINLGFNITGDTITSEIRSQPSQDGPLVATWTVTIINATTGEIKLAMNAAVSGGINVETGWMDLKWVHSGSAKAIFESPLEVSIRDTVTA